MKTLWAPWRMEYILSPKGGSHCIFCGLPGEKKDRENLILHRTDLSYVIMNRYPYNNGHLMVVPYKHVSDLDLSPETLKDMMALVKYSVSCLRKAFRPEGFNIGLNIGKVAGAGIEEHLHMHIVPRWGGDASFMTVLGEVRVIPEHILDTYDKLHPIFNGE